jgi:hypothetical protein
MTSSNFVGSGPQQRGFTSALYVHSAQSFWPKNHPFYAKRGSVLDSAAWPSACNCGVGDRHSAHLG